MRASLFSLLLILTAAFSGWMVSQHSPYLMLSVTGAVAIFVISFINTEWGLYILIFSMLLSPEFVLGSTSSATLGRGVTVRLDDFMLVVIGFSWLAKNAYHKELGLFRKTPLNRPIFYYILICVISTSIGVLGSRVSPKTGYLYVVKYFEYCIVFFMVVNHTEDIRHVRRFVFCILLTCLITCIMGILQIPSGERVSAPFEGETGEPNTFGGYLLFVGAIACGMLSTSDTLKKKLSIAFLLALMLIPFLYTRSRSSYFALIPMLLISGYMTRRRWLILGMMILAFAASPLFLPDMVKERILYTFTQPEEFGQIRVGNIRIDTSASERITSWKRAVLDWTKHPLLGYGVTGYPFLDAQFPRVLVETGILGLAAFFYLLYSIFQLAISNLKILTNPYFIGLTRGVIAGFAALLVHAIGANTFLIVRIMEPFWFMVGIMSVLPELNIQSKESSKPL